MVNPFETASKQSKKRLRSLRSRKDTTHPLTKLPSELQLRIMTYCDSKTLSAFSLLSNHFRELSLRVMWETQPVETYIKNFDQLDEHEDLRLAVRHLAIRKQSTPNKSRFSGVTKRLVTRFPRNYFSGLQEFTIEFEPVSSDDFVTIMNTLSKYQPKRLKTLNITLNYHRGSLNNATNKYTIIYPTGLTTIMIRFGYSAQLPEWDPFKVLDANSDTLTTAKVYFGHWYKYFSLKPCPKVTTLYARQDVYDKGYARELSIKFPNTENLILSAPCEVLWLHSDVATIEKYADWSHFSRVKSVEITYPHNAPYSKNISYSDNVLRHVRLLAIRWIRDGDMPNLEVIKVMVVQPLTNITTHSFTLQIEIKDACRVVTTGEITKLPDEI
ncbi:uncharacterized protein DFL_009721 [Arthrobotrys flagrans]|uniref:F-box domain-containing protein n=1 Tax=Arthrobotrys flagrans TaxID=97331 RepID=A0A436ZSG4_ARTFL|nr:hypothetical protein DFL_009721 [Arthrobotrys flagrans]